MSPATATPESIIPSTSTSPPALPISVDPDLERLRSLYSSRLRRFEEEERQFQRQADRLSLFRLLAFVGGCGGALALLDVENTVALLLLASGLITFGLLITRHQAALVQREHRRRCKQVNQRELDRLDRRWAGLDAAEARLDPEHPYTADLDIFGERSLYQFVCRAHTGMGRKTLADWLEGPGQPEPIRQRQAAVEDLTSRLDWRQDFEARGLQAEESKADPTAFLDWLAQPAVVSGRPQLTLLVRLAPWLTIGLLLAGWLLSAPALSFLGALLVVVNITVNLSYEAQVRRCHASTSRQAKLFQAYVEMLAAIETSGFQAPALVQLRDRLTAAGLKASQQIGRLAGIVHHLDLRYGMMHFPINSLTLWDLRWMIQLEEWKRDCAAPLGGWFEAIGQIEALASLAGLRHDHAHWVLPEIEEGPPLLEAEGLGHPLIPRHKAVLNDFGIRGPSQVAIVSGSNMAGKSTFLRSLGTNAVLALAGGPVCATRFRVSPMTLYTSMRTQDSLGESTSLFYAELKRLKRTIDAVARQEPVLFLLDEILKGTNSRDRHTGSEALIRQLHRGGGTGLIATHDLELARLEEELAGHVRNFSFESEAADGRLLFDYKLKRGVCTSLNAVKLMQSMGIEIPG